jgi:hypothetical protein
VPQSAPPADKTPAAVPNDTSRPLLGRSSKGDRRSPREAPLTKIHSPAPQDSRDHRSHATLWGEETQCHDRRRSPPLTTTTLRGEALQPDTSQVNPSTSILKLLQIADLPEAGTATASAIESVQRGTAAVATHRRSELPEVTTEKLERHNKSEFYPRSSTRLPPNPTNRPRR